MIEKKGEPYGEETVSKLIKKIESKHCYKSISVVLSEEEWITLNQISVITGLTKNMIVKVAINQMLKEVIARKQKNIQNVILKTNIIKPTKKNKTLHCSSSMPATMYNTIVSYAKNKGLKAYEVYSALIEEFLDFAKNSETKVIYKECPPNSPKRSITLFFDTVQGIKELKYRDHVTEYNIIYNAALRFLTKRAEFPTQTKAVEVAQTNVCATVDGST